MVVVGVLLAVLVVVTLVMVVRQGRAQPQGRQSPAVSVVEEDRGRVVLDVGDIDPHSLAAARLLDDVANRAFAALPDVTIIDIRSSTGAMLGTRRRERPREIAIPADLYEPPTRSHAGPDLSDFTEPSGAGSLPRVSHESVDVAGPHRPLADRFDLPASVRDSLPTERHDDPVALVAAILDAAGHRVERDGELLVAGDTAVLVLRAPIGAPVGGELLSHAFRRFEESGAHRGLVITPGFMDPTDVRRREVMAPVVLHVGPEGIQRMADAVALGCDPLRFAVAPPLASA